MGQSRPVLEHLLDLDKSERRFQQPFLSRWKTASRPPVRVLLAIDQALGAERVVEGEYQMPTVYIRALRNSKIPHAGRGFAGEDADESRRWFSIRTCAMIQ